MSDRLYVLVKQDNSYFNYYCLCLDCAKNTYHKIKLFKWEVIRKGSHDEMLNQTNMLNKLYGKS